MEQGIFHPSTGNLFGRTGKFWGVSGKQFFGVGRLYEVACLSSNSCWQYPGPNRDQRASNCGLTNGNKVCERTLAQLAENDRYEPKVSLSDIRSISRKGLEADICGEMHQGPKWNKFRCNYNRTNKHRRPIQPSACFSSGDAGAFALFGVQNWKSAGNRRAASKHLYCFGTVVMAPRCYREQHATISR